MRLQECWLCDDELTATSEHIIPASIGGKKTVRDFICRNCNSRTGHEWDIAVTTFESWKFQLSPDLHVNPQRGRPIRGRMGDTELNVFIDAGGQVRMGYNPPVISDNAAGEVFYQFTSDPGRVDELFDSVNRLLLRKNRAPMSRDEFDARIQHNVTHQPVVSFTLKLDMPKYYRSIVKTSMAMAFSTGVHPTECENAVRYLRDETLEEAGVVSLPGTTLDGTIEDWVNYHAVTIFGFQSSRQLIGEVLYFGSVAGLVILSNSYDGPSIVEGHSINLKTGEYVDANLQMPDLHLPAYSVFELMKGRLGLFKSPMVYQILSNLNRIVDQA